MSPEADVKRQNAFITRFLLVALVALGFSLGLFAGSKGLYCDGQGFLFHHLYDGMNNYVLGLDQQVGPYWGGGWSQIWVPPEQLGDQGSVGACVFNGRIYGFYTTTDGKLQYVTQNPTNYGDQTGPTTISTEVYPRGASAVVYSGAIYVFTAPFFGFTSADGKNFSTWDPYFTQMVPNNMLAAVTMYPMGDDPAGIMLVYNDANDPPVLRSCILYPPSKEPVAQSRLDVGWPCHDKADRTPLPDQERSRGDSERAACKPPVLSGAILAPTSILFQLAFATFSRDCGPWR